MANPPPPKMPPPPKKPTAPWRLKLGKAVPGLLAAFMVGGLLQAFLAGYGIENLGAAGMDAHVAFAHVIEALPLLVAIVGFVGADWRGGVGGVVLLALFQLQYVFLAFGPAEVRALHALNGVVMVLVAAGLFVHRMPWGGHSAFIKPGQKPGA